jgi:hypothetical protein
VSLIKEKQIVKIKKRVKWFFPLCSFIVIFAGWNSCYDIMDVIILLVLWFSIFLFAMLLICYPSLTKNLNTL